MEDNKVPNKYNIELGSKFLCTFFMSLSNTRNRTKHYLFQCNTRSLSIKDPI